MKCKSSIPGIIKWNSNSHCFNSTWTVDIIHLYLYTQWQHVLSWYECEDPLCISLEFNNTLVLTHSTTFACVAHS